MHKFRVTVNGLNRVEIFIDDVKMKGVKAIGFSACVDGMPTITLTFNAPEVVVEGVADVTAFGDTDRRFKAA